MSDKNWKPNKQDGKLAIHGVISRLSREEFENEYLCKPSAEDLDKHKRAFDALLAYEKNCILKYDYPDNSPSRPPSRPPKKGEQMEDYARTFDVEIKDMKACWREVERALENGL